MPIELLWHHVAPVGELEFWVGVFSGWAERGLRPTMKEFQQIVLPRLKLEKDKDGKPVYGFLTHNRTQRHKFSKRWVECYQAYLNKDYVEIPDYDPKTGMQNKDYLCEECPNWKDRCNKSKHLDINNLPDPLTIDW